MVVNLEAYKPCYGELLVVYTSQRVASKRYFWKFQGFTPCLRNKKEKLSIRNHRKIVNSSISRARCFEYSSRLGFNGSAGCRILFKPWSLPQERTWNSPPPPPPLPPYLDTHIKHRKFGTLHRDILEAFSCETTLDSRCLMINKPKPSFHSGRELKPHPCNSVISLIEAGKRAFVPFWSIA